MPYPLSPIVGYVVWTALWLTGNATVFAEAGEVISAGEAFTETGPMLGVLTLSIGCSLTGGVAAAFAGGERARGAVLGKVLLLLATRIFVQAGLWSLMPARYHLLFLALLAPMTLVGGTFVSRRQRRPDHATCRYLPDLDPRRERLRCRGSAVCRFRCR